MNVQDIIQYGIAIAGGGAGIKVVEVMLDYFKNKRQNSVEFKKIESESKVALTRLEIENEDKFRLELWDRIKGLEARVTDLDRKEQECWDKYNLLFKNNAELAAELNYVKTILHSSSSEIIKLLPKREENK